MERESRHRSGLRAQWISPPWASPASDDVVDRYFTSFHRNTRSQRCYWGALTGIAGTRLMQRFDLAVSRFDKFLTATL